MGIEDKAFYEDAAFAKPKELTSEEISALTRKERARLTFENLPQKYFDYFETLKKLTEQDEKDLKSDGSLVHIKFGAQVERVQKYVFYKKVCHLRFFAVCRIRNRKFYFVKNWRTSSYLGNQFLWVVN